MEPLWHTIQLTIATPVLGPDGLKSVSQEKRIEVETQR